MIIKSCPCCEGRPYTRNYDLILCPQCGTALEPENATEEMLSGRPVLSGTDSGSGSPYTDAYDDVYGDPYTDRGQDNPYGEGDSEPDPLDEPWTWEHDPPPDPQPELPPDPQPIWQPPAGSTIAPPDTGPNPTRGNRRVQSALGTTIRGRISHYSCTGSEDGNYRRLLFHRIYDAIVYRQRFENLLHRFTVRAEGGTDAFGNQEYFDVPVNVHGTIAGGLQLADNNEVEVTGTYRGSTLMAREITVISNGLRTPVRFQHAAGLIALSIAALVALIFGIYVAVDSSNGGSIWPAIVDFLKTWAVIYLILLGLFLMFCLSRFGFHLLLLLTRGQRSHPFLTILLISLILTVLILAKFGSAGNLLSTLGALGMAILPAVLVVLLMVYLLFRLIFPF